MPINIRQGSARSVTETGNLNHGAAWGSAMVNLCPGRELDQNQDVQSMLQCKQHGKVFP